MIYLKNVLARGTPGHCKWHQTTGLLYVGLEHHEYLNSNIFHELKTLLMSFGDLVLLYTSRIYLRPHKRLPAQRLQLTYV